MITQSKTCPWCKSPDKAVRLEVPGFRMGCYNDWHKPLCKNCGKGAYSHGHAWGCQRYEAVEVLAEQAA